MTQDILLLSPFKEQIDLSDRVLINIQEEPAVLVEGVHVGLREQVEMVPTGSMDACWRSSFAD